MANVAVDIYTKKASAPYDPIPGVDVYVYIDGVGFVTASTSDSNGLAALLLPENAVYQLRFHKSGVTMQSYANITVGTANIEATVYGTVQENVVSNDSRYCLVQGYCVGWSRRIPSDATITFTPVNNPQVVDGKAVLQSKERIIVGNDGWAQVHLLRGQSYDVDIQGYLTPVRTIRVPDSLSANLSNVLFPVINVIVFDAGGSLPAGTSRDITPEVWTNAPVQLEGAAIEDLDWTSSDSGILQVVASADKVTLVGVQAGTAEVIATRKDTAYKSIPDVELTGMPVSVTVV